MSPSPVIDESCNEYTQRGDIASNKEIVFIFLIFLFVLAILYPEKMLRKQVLAEKSNYELAGVYLENMLRLEPNNIKLMLAAADVSLERGNLDLAEKLLEVLRKNDNPAIKKRLEKIEFKLFKTQLAHSNDAEYAAKKKQQLVKILNQVAQQHLFDKKDALLWYRNATALSQKKAAKIFLESLVEKLSQKEDPSAKEWMISAWTLYADEGNYKKAAEILEQLVKIDPSYRDILAQVRAAAGDFTQSADLYMLLYRTSGSYERKKEYLLKAIEALKDGKMYDEAVALIQRYENDYLHDEAMVQKLIKYYLSMNKIEAAQKLSLKLLEKDQ